MAVIKSLQLLTAVIFISPGAVIEVMGIKSAMTIRDTMTTSTGGGTTNAQFTYINHGTDYSPGWRRTAAPEISQRHRRSGRYPSGGTAVSSINLASKGRVTALTDNTRGAAGLELYEVYNNGYQQRMEISFHLKGMTAVGEGELLIGWSGTAVLMLRHLFVHDGIRPTQTGRRGLFTPRLILLRVLSSRCTNPVAIRYRSSLVVYP